MHEHTDPFIKVLTFCLCMHVHTDLFIKVVIVHFAGMYLHKSFKIVINSLIMYVFNCLYVSDSDAS